MDEQVELLRGIWDEMKALNGHVNTTNERLVNVERGLATTNERLGTLEGAVHAGFRGLSERIDAVHGANRDSVSGVTVAAVGRRAPHLQLESRCRLPRRLPPSRRRMVVPRPQSQTRGLDPSPSAAQR